MTIPTALAADLGLLTDALDLPGSDVAATLEALASDAATAIPSYLGLSVRVRTQDSHVELTTLAHHDDLAAITTSIRVPLSDPTSSVGDDAPLVLILYAQSAGAFVDLAADLAWLTGRPLKGVRLDEDLSGPSPYAATRSLRHQSSIDQAIGVLIGAGRTPEQARTELTARATAAGVEVVSAAHAVLASIAPSPPTTVEEPALPGL